MSSSIIRQKLLSMVSDGAEDYESVLNFAADNSNSVVYMTRQRFINASGSSEEEVERFLIALGVNSFEELKRIIRDLRYTIGYTEVENNQWEMLQSVTDAVTRYELSNISSFCNNIDLATVDMLAKDILGVPGVIVVGTGVSVPVVNYAEYILSKTGIKITRISAIDSNSLGLVPNFDRNMLVLGFAFSRYPKSTISLLSLMKKKGFKIVTVTDSPCSPTSNFSDYLITVTANSMEFTESYISQLMLLNVLAVYIGLHDKNGLLQRLKDYDETAQNLGFFF